MSSELTRKNGCIYVDCIVPLPCERKVVPKSQGTFCVYRVTLNKRSSIRVGGNKTK